MRILYPILVALFAAGCGDDPFATTPSPNNTDIFASTLSVRGSSAREFIVTRAGSVTITIDAMSPVFVVGLAVGKPDAASAGCAPTMTINTAGGASDALTTSLDPGSYCVKVSDIGNLTQNASFSISIVRQ